MSEVDPAPKMRRMYDEIFNKGNLDAMDEAFFPDVVFHSPVQREPIHGLDKLKPFVSQLRVAFPDLQVEIQEMISEDDKIAVYYIAKGTHKGDYFGIPPTGRRVEIPELEFHRLSLAEGKVQEMWLVFNVLDVLQQLGIFPRGNIPRPLARAIVTLQKVRSKLQLRRSKRSRSPE